MLTRMNSVTYAYISHQKLPQGLLRTIRALGEFKGKQELYKEQAPQVLENLRQTAIIQSTESSNRIEGVSAPLERIRALVANKTKPQNRSEAEIAGYKMVLDLIHTRYGDIPLSTGIVLQLHRDLFQFTDRPAGKWKPIDNEIEELHPDGTKVIRFKPVPAYQTADAMEKLHVQFNKLWASGEVEPLLLIPAYVLDFLCIHPFLDGNGRMGRLLTLLLLYKAGYEVGRFISLERIIEETKDGYYDTLHQCSQGWHEANHPIIPWWEYFLAIVMKAYQEFEGRVGVLVTAKGAKIQMVQGVIKAMPSEFTIAELRSRCPGVGIDHLRKILRQERLGGRLVSVGRGPQARWRKSTK